MAATVPIPRPIQQKVNDIMVKFVVPHRKTFLKMEDFCLARSMGGYEIDHIVAHAQLFILQPIVKYVQAKENGQALTSSQYYIEYNLGQQLSSFYQLPRDNRTPHRHKPNDTYRYILNILLNFKFPKEDLMKGKIKGLYNCILDKFGAQRGGANYGLMHASFLPNYLKTFNFQVHFELLPLKSKFVDFALDNDSSCSFCRLNYETPSHLFSTCLKLQPLWSFLDETVCLVSNHQYEFSNRRRFMYDFDIVNTRCHKSQVNLIIFLNTVVNFNIWKYRNELNKDKTPFLIEDLIGYVIRSVRARSNVNMVLGNRKQFPQAEEVLRAMVLVKNSMFHFDRG